MLHKPTSLESFLRTMEGEVHTLSGLSQSGCRQVNYVLSIDTTFIDDSQSTSQDTNTKLAADCNLGEVFMKCKHLIEIFSYMIEQEMIEAKYDLQYWRDLAESVELEHGWLEIFVARYHSKMNPYKLFARSNALVMPSPHSSASTTPETSLLLTAEESIFSLATDFQKLCCLLALVKDSSDHLKMIYNEVQMTSRYDMLEKHSSTQSAQNIGATPRNNHDVTKIKTYAAEHISSCLQTLQYALDNFVNVTVGPPVGGYNIDEALDSNRLDTLDGLLQHVDERISTLDCETQQGALTRFVKGQVRYPIGIISSLARRPPDVERRWISDTCTSALTIFGINRVVKNWQSGWIQQTALEGGMKLYVFGKEQVVDRLRLLAADLQDTLQVESSITHKEVLCAQETLQKSLDNWAKTEAGQRWLLWDYFKKLNWTQGSPPAAAAVADLDRATLMTSLMKTFEKDVKNPFVGLLFGNMLTNLFIQIQNMEVMTLEAFLHVNKLMAQNRLTMAVTAAFPACAALFVLLFALKKLLIPSKQSTSKHAKQLKQLLAEVERSLTEVYSYMENEESAQRHVPGSPRKASFVRQVSSQYFSPPIPSGSPNSLLPPSFIDSLHGGSQHKSIGAYSHNRIYIARGQLCYDILRLRHTLTRFFTDHNYITKVYSYLCQLIGVGMGTRIRASVSAESSPLYSWLPVRILYRLWTGQSARRFEGDSEYHQILKDLLKIESRDEDVPPRIKLAIVSRLRTYGCFSAI